MKIEQPRDEVEDAYTDDDLFRISSWGADLSFRELIARYDDNELVKPELQRHYVWDRVEASRFIDSILLGLPVPSIFLAKTNDEKLLIIDGYQRLMTVRDFVKGVFSDDNSVFALSNSQKVNERWRGKAFSQLLEEEQRKIRNTTIHAIIFMQQHPAAGDTSLYQIFERINTSGRSLMPQEIRNCVYQGPLNSMLIKLNELREWRLMWGADKRDSRMRDLELILRFFALSDKYILESNVVPYNISLKKYLNQYMGANNSVTATPDLENKFRLTAAFVYKNFGTAAFHNISPSDATRFVPNLSSTLFDAVMIASWKIVSLGLTARDPAEYRQRKTELLRSPDFQKLLSQETMRSANIRKRVELMFEALTGDGNEQFRSRHIAAGVPI
ncbi:DUF262 domain-containing protein [Zoogloea sp.]|uniref:DUF262 domain-containing protein n=1 Tax=Zoogloea sp. TaxID=49181 RepID=UPI00321F694D